MKKLDFRKIGQRTLHFMADRYLLGLLLGLGLIFLLPGRSSIYSHISYTSNLVKKEAEKRELEESIEQGRLKLDQLRFRKGKLEKYARESFLMKAEDEDIYLLEP